METIEKVFTYMLFAAAIVGFIFMFGPKKTADQFDDYLMYYNQNFQGKIIKHDKDKQSRGSYTIWLNKGKFIVPENIFMDTRVGDSVVKNVSRYYIIYRNGLFYDSLDLNNNASTREFLKTHFSTPFTN